MWSSSARVVPNYGKMPGKVCGKGGADEQKFHSSELILCFDKF